MKSLISPLFFIYSLTNLHVKAQEGEGMSDLAAFRLAYESGSDRAIKGLNTEKFYRY